MAPQTRLSNHPTNTYGGEQITGGPGGLRAIALLYLLWWGLGCVTPTPTSRAIGPDLVLVTIDTLRADRLGAYGYFRDTSPAFDALAQESVLFERCIAPMATSFPSHLSLLTSTAPGEVGALANVGAGGAPFVSNPRIQSLAEVLAAEGYQTAAFVSATPLKAHTGINAGFTYFDEPEQSEQSGFELNRKVRKWIGSIDPDRPLFLWVHYFEPHAPYAPHPANGLPPAEIQLLEDQMARQGTDPNPEALETQDLYDQEVRTADWAMNELLSFLGNRLDPSEDILVIVGDHGEGLGQHGEAQHGGLWGEQLRVPLLIRAPGLAPSRELLPVTLVDVVPTLFGLAGLPGGTHLPGKDVLQAQLAGRNLLSGALSDSEQTAIFSQESGAPWRVSPGDSPQYALTGPRFKLIHDPAAGPQLFDLQNDPYELQDLANEEPELVAVLMQDLRAELDQQRKRRARFFQGQPFPKIQLAPGIEEQLRSLGYL